MKRLFSLFLFCYLAFSCFAIVCTFTGNGSWYSAYLWQDGIMPTADDDVVISTGSTAYIPEGNTYCHNLTLNGHLIGPYGNTGHLYAGGDLYISPGYGIQPGSYGNITVNLGGSLAVYGYYVVNQTYLESTSTGISMTTGNGVTLNGHFTMTGASQINMGSNLYFQGTSYSFYSATFNMNGYELNNITLNTTVINGDSAPGTSQLTNCALYSSVINGYITTAGNVYLQDNGSQFTYLTNNGNLYGAYGSTTSVTITDFQNNGLVAPGSYGNLNVYVTGNMVNTSNLSCSYLYFTGSGTSDFQNTGVLYSHIYNYAPTLQLHENTLNLNGKTFMMGNAVAEGSPFIQNANITNGIYANPDMLMLNLEGSNLTNCQIHTPVSINGTVSLQDSNTHFYDNLNIYGTFYGAYGAATYVTIDGNLNQLGGSVYSGSYGTFYITLLGNLNNQSGVFNPTRLTFSGSNTQNWAHTSAALYSHFVNASEVNLTTGTVMDMHGYNLSMGTFIAAASPTFLNVNISNGTYTGSAANQLSLSNCNAVNCTFNTSVAIIGQLVLNDNNTVFGSDVSISGSLYGQFGTATYTTIQGNLNQLGGSVYSGSYGSFSIYLYGNLNNDAGVFNPTNLYFNSITPQYWTHNTAALYVHVTNNTSLHLTSSTIIDMHGYNLYLGDFHTDGNGGFRNVNMISGAFHNPLHTCTIANATLRSVTFDGNEQLFDSVTLLDNEVYFMGDLTVNGSMTGATSVSITTHISGDWVFDTGSVSPGNYGTFYAYLQGDLRFINPAVSNSYTVNTTYFNGSGGQDILSNGSTLYGNLYVQNPVGLRAFNNLSLNGNSIYLNGTSLRLQNHTLYNAHVNNGTLSDGTFNAGGFSSLVLHDIVILGNVVTEDDLSSFTGISTNNGNIIGRTSATSCFYTYDSFINNGVIQAGNYGTMLVIVFGSVTNNTSSWSANTYLRGTDPRTLNASYLGSSVVADNGSFTLTGANIMPSFSITNGYTVTVDTGATLTFSGSNAWYSGDLLNLGTVTNSRLLSSNSALPYYHCTLNNAGSDNPSQTLTVSHVVDIPLPQPASPIREYWSMQYSGGLEVVTGSLVLYYSPGLLNGVDINNIILYRSLDGGNTWYEMADGWTANQSNNSVTIPNPQIGNVIYMLGGIPPISEPITIEGIHTTGSLHNTIRWQPVPDAVSYHIYTAATPVGPWSYTAHLTANQYEDTVALRSRFYKVVAVH